MQYEALARIAESLPYVLGGTVVTLALVVAAMFTGLLLGVPLAVLQVYGRKWPRRLVRLYVWFFRGTPILVLLFLFYFGLFPLLGLNLPDFFAACLVLGLTSASYQSQIFRGAILSIPQGQLKAARALGLSDAKAIRGIILPQALRMSIPAWSNEYSIILKDSALAFTIGVLDIMARTHFMSMAPNNKSYQLEFFACAGALYLVITVAGVKLLRLLERRVRIPGYARS